MLQPLKNDAAIIHSDPGRAESAKPQVLNTARATNVWKPVIVRVVLSGLALLGLAGVGVASMLTGLDGARAHSPQAPHATALQASASAALANQAAAQNAPAISAQLPVTDAAATGAAAACAGRTPDGKVILNLATFADLRTLPGIGQKRADAILALRDKLKRFKRIQELRRVRGIGAKSLMKLAPKLLVDAPAGMCEKPADGR